MGRNMMQAMVNISIHALREEGDNAIGGKMPEIPISIHALREEGDYSSHSSTAFSWISIHALREEGDLEVVQQRFAEVLISIHALREEGDTRQSHHRDSVIDFYPRPPRGGRPPRQ